MAKRENNYSSIEDLMKVVIKENNLTKGMNQMNVKDVWANLMGNGVVSYTESVQLQNKTLIVKLKSSVLREELSYGKEKIIKMLNDELGEELITKLMLV
ncbi:MAG: RNA-binding protein [Bacteroidetes bacterium MedPE-SWsnd-G1]|nr:MAG: RNA-binding protein [Bacteroidetes bacterium MedPE-SWsnd-G1]